MKTVLKSLLLVLLVVLLGGISFHLLGIGFGLLNTSSNISVLGGVLLIITDIILFIYGLSLTDKLAIKLFNNKKK